MRTNPLLIKLGLDLVRVRFLAQTERVEGCLLWRGAKTTGGYGTVKIQGWRAAHRAAFFLHHLRWPKHLLCHQCDTKLCVEPAHLKDAPHRVNMREMAKRKRAKQGKPLAPEVIESIRKARKQGLKVKAIAANFGVRPDHVTRICRGKRHGYGRKGK